MGEGTDERKTATEKYGASPCAITITVFHLSNTQLPLIQPIIAKESPIRQIARLMLMLSKTLKVVNGYLMYQAGPTIMHLRSPLEEMHLAHLQNGFEQPYL